ncbi:MAG: ABC transporter ATP-binding protein [Anaerolineales bacterium]
MSFFSGLDSEAYDRQYSDRQLLARMAAYFRVHVRRLIAVSALVILLALSGAALPILVARGVDALASTLQDVLMWLLVGAVLASGVFNWGANWLRRRLTQRIVGDVILRLRADAFEAAAHHDLSFYDRFSSGRIVSRITSDTNEFGQVVVLVTDLISQLVQAAILGVVLVRTEWRLAALLFAFLPGVFWLAVGFRSLARRVTRRGMQAMANVNAAIKETVSGIAVAKNFRQEAGIYAEFDAANRTSFRVNVQRGFVLSLVFPTLNAISGIGTAILLYAGGRQTLAGTISVGAWYLFLSSLDRFWFPILNLSSFWAQIQSGLSASERVFALMDADSAVAQHASRLLDGRLRGEILFEHVDFRYADHEPVLADFNLHIAPGENIALVGHTGAGKSSIARLIARFYEFQAGRILVDGRDIRSLDLIAYRRQLGIVSQVPFLFSGTVVENIRYACPQASPDEIVALAMSIGEGEWLETLPNGLETEVGERGSRLSMGQRQLVALLRVLVQNPAIFILDEATASIDPFTEWQIQQALDMVLRNTTSILIAHRLSTVRAADRILVLEQGGIIEAGSHEQLLQRGGHYADLYNTYFRHQSLAYAEQQGRSRLGGGA